MQSEVMGWVGTCLATAATAALASVQISVEDIQELIDKHLNGDAVALMEKCAETLECDPQVLLLLAEHHISGATESGESADYAIELLTRAARDGDSKAMIRLGELLEQGIGVPANPEHAFHWYERAASQGNTTARIKVAEAILANASLDDRLTEAVEILKQTSGEHPRAACVLGTLYEAGTIIERDLERAEAAYQRAMHQLPSAKRRYARLLFQRSESDPMRLRVATLLAEAAQDGDLPAAGYLGSMLEHGQGIQRDLNAALESYRIAAEGGLSWAEEGRQRLEERLRSISLFGIRIYGAQREEVRQRMIALGASRMTHTGPSWVDVFDASSLVDGAETLSAAYAPGMGAYVAELSYTFSQHSMRAASTSARSLIDQLTARYGAANRQRVSGKAPTHSWNLGEITIVMGTTRDRGTRLRYRFAPFADSLQSAAQGAAKEQDATL